MASRRALVIGGNGFLGRYIVAELAKEHVVHVLDLHGLERGEDTGSAVVQHRGSVTDPSLLRDAIGAAQPDLIVVLASYGGGGVGLLRSAERDPRAAVDVNVVGLLNVLEASRSLPDVRVIWFSSTTVYGPAEHYVGGLADETSLVLPGSVYGASKVMGEQLIRTYRANYGVSAVAVRPTLVWGPGIRYYGVQSGLNTIVEAAASGAPIEVPDCIEEWDLLYVRDAGRAVTWLVSAPDVEPVVLVNGYSATIRTVRDVVQAQVPGARINFHGVRPPLGYPKVRDQLARNAGFAPAFDLPGSVADYLITIRDHAIADRAPQEAQTI